MKIQCAWCKKGMGEKAPYDDPSVSHTICRECSIKFLGVDPEERRKKEGYVPNPIPTGIEKLANGERVQRLKPKRIAGMEDWKLYASVYSKRDLLYETQHAKRSGWKIKTVFDKYAGQWLIWVTVPKNPYSTRAKYCHERVASPRKFDKRSYRTKTLGKGVKVVFGCPKGKYSPRKSRCKVGMRMQKRLIPVGARGCKIGGKTLGLRHNPIKGKQLDKSMWVHIIKETAEYLKRAGYDKDSTYISIVNRLRGIPDSLIRRSITEVYRIGKNKRCRR